MKYSVRAFNGGTFWVPGPEVYWMEAWNRREEMHALIYLVQGGGHNILINTGPPQDLTIINKAWLSFFGYPEAQIARTDAQLPQNILLSQGLTPDDISLVLVTPLQAYATANIPMFRNAKIGIIGYGTSHWGITESRDQLRGEYGIETDYLRLRAYPFTREVHEFVEQHEHVYVVEQNRDAQMLSLLKLDVKAELIPRLRSIAHITGLPLDARSITDELTSMEGK